MFNKTPSHVLFKLYAPILSSERTDHCFIAEHNLLSYKDFFLICFNVIKTNKKITRHILELLK